MRWTLRVLAWTAFALSAYLTYASLSHTKVVGCAGGESVDCDAVLNTQWSSWLGLPVALGGLACYAALASLTMFLGAHGAAARRWIGSLVIMLAVVAGGAGLWFIALQLLVIHKICTFCMCVHACGVILASLVLWTMVFRPMIRRLRLSRESVERQVLVLQSSRPAAAAMGSPSSAGIDGPLAGLALTGALAVLMLLVGGQVLFPPAMYVTVDSASLDETIEMDAAGVPAPAPMTAARPVADASPAAKLPVENEQVAAEPTAAPSASEKPVAAAQTAPATHVADDLFADRRQPAEDEGDASDRLAAPTHEPAVERHAVASDPQAEDSAADLIAVESARQPAAADRSNAKPPAPRDTVDELFATSSVSPSPAASAGTAGGDRVARSSVARDGQPEPVVPVSTEGGTQAAKTADWQNVASDPDAAPHERIVTLLNGKLKLDMTKHPVLGSIDAPNVIVELASYDCPHCRTMHPMIEQGLKRYDGQLAVVEMIVPLEMGCNKYVTSSQYSHRGSCTLARLALAVATIDPSAFPAFHEWLMADPLKPPSPEKAMTHAYKIVDRERLREVMQSKALQAQINSYVELYTALQNLSKHQGKAFGLPVQIVGPAVISGDLSDVGQLYWTWEKNLNLRPHGSVPAGQTSLNP